MKNFFLCLILSIFFIFAAKANESVPVDIEADSMQWDDENRIAYAIGNAEAIQGNRKIIADKLTVYLNKEKSSNEVLLIEAEGNVIFTNNDEIATAQEAKYNLVKNNIILKNDVKLTKNENIMAGQILEMDLESGISKIKSVKEKDRVRIRFSSTTEEKNDE